MVSRKITTSIIIKALNEQENIGRCIASCLEAFKNKSFEIIVVDGGSKDNTINIAKQYPVKILKVKNYSQKGCGAQSQIGYLYSKGRYVYLVDGDMVVNKEFIPKAMQELKKPLVSGVSGIIYESKSKSLISKKHSERYRKSKTGFVDYLYGGGIYKRNAIEHVGYLANPYLQANEEVDLGYLLVSKGYKLVRLKQIAVKHFRDDKSSIMILLNKLTSGYLKGPGQVLRYSLGNRNIFIKHLRRQKIYIGNLFYWVGLLVSVPLGIVWFYIGVTLGGILILSLLKGFNQAVLSLLSWNLTTFSSIVGFLERPRPVASFDYKVTKVKW